MVFTINLSTCQDVSHVGGKAYNLSVLINNNVLVPKGFVVTCEAFDAFLNANNLNIESCSPDDIINGKFPSDIEEDIAQQYANIFKEEKLVAVRSSGVSEDSAEHAYAGMYSSYLNTPREDLFLKIKECWASSRNERVLQYAKGDKTSLSPSMGVVVQEMVPSESAGVIFTMNPVTQDKAYFVINSSFGLGESVVSGHVTPDTFICHKLTGEIMSQSIFSDTPSLSPEALEKVLELARKIQDIFSAKGPQDIEFAWDGKSVWALQARPVTTVSKNNNSNNTTSNSNTSRQNDICCNHETVDVFPEVITPLTWTTFDYIVHNSIQQRYKQKDIVFPLDCSMYELHWGRVYQNLTVADMMVQAEFGFNPDQSTKALKGDLWKPERTPSTTPLIERIKGLGRLMTSLWDSTATATRVTKVIIDCENWCKQKEIELQNVGPEKINDESMNAFRKVITDKFCEFGCEYIDIFYHATEVFLESAAKNLGGKTDYFIAALLTDLGGVFTFEMNKELRKLSETAAGDEKNEKWKNFRTELAVTAFVTQFTKFLENYGYRAINELEAASTRWSEDPTFLFGQILAMAKLQPTSPLPSGSGAERQATEAKLMSQVPFLQRYLTKWAIGKMQDYTRLRENAKCVLVRFIALSRSYLLRAASAFVARGVIAQEHDVFFLRLSDLDEIFAGAHASAGDASELAARMRERVRENAARMEWNRKLVFPELFVGSVPRFATRSDGSDTLTGIGASCGIVQGTARVLYSPNERDKLLSKDVCSTTDPAWTPLFACCSALVTVHGGMLSHGAIVAREFGIPAVVGVAKALPVIKDGMLINVDGNTGVVTIVG